MRIGINKNINSLNSKLLIGLLASMIYRIITILISLFYANFFLIHTKFTYQQTSMAFMYICFLCFSYSYQQLFLGE